MRNYFLIFLLAFFSHQIVAQEQIEVEVEENPVELQWEKTFKKALKKSKRQKKPVLLYFRGSDWCGPCKTLEKELFYTEKFKAIADNNLILLEVDIPRNKDILSEKKNEENSFLKRKYKVKSFPSLIFVNHRGRVIQSKKGVILTEYYYPFIQSVIANY